MSEIAPCITVETEEEYKASIERMRPYAERVHIDISDGEFAPVFLVDVNKLWWPKEWIIDVHAMVMHPTEYVDKLINLRPKPNLITFHAETGIDLVPIINKIKKAEIKAGIALLKPTVPEDIAPAIKEADHILIFSGDLGHYGGRASMMQLEKIRLIKNINPKVEIGWDGGVSIDNAFSLSQGGVDVLNVGGALSNAEDSARVYATLVDEINKQGIL
jgi:ribulose-phosphate 3-epimerase